MRQKFMYLVISMIALNLIFAGFYSIQNYEEPAPDSIKVMTYNIHLLYSNTPETQGNYILNELRDLIEESEAGIIGLQESDTSRVVAGNQHGVKWLANQLDMYYYFGADTQDESWGVSLLSKWEITGAQAISLPSENALQRVAVVATVNIPEPFGPVDVLVTHLTYQSVEDQADQIAKIIDLSDEFDNRFMVMGDFNLVLNQEAGSTLETDPSFLVLNNTYTDGWIAAGGAFDEFTSYYFADEVELANSRIDYIWLSDGWDVVENSAQILGDESLSDHRAVLIEIK